MCRLLPAVLILATGSVNVAHADILYCAPGDGQVVLRSGSTVILNSEPTVRSVDFSMVPQLAGTVRLDLVYKNGRKDSYTITGDSSTDFHNMARQSGDGRDKSCP